MKSVKYGAFEITEEERNKFITLYPKFFEVRKMNEDAKTLNLDQKLEIVREYITENNRLPTDRYKTETGFALGKFIKLKLIKIIH